MITRVGQSFGGKSFGLRVPPFFENIPAPRRWVLVPADARVVDINCRHPISETEISQKPTEIRFVFQRRSPLIDPLVVTDQQRNQMIAKKRMEERKNWLGRHEAWITRPSSFPGLKIVLYHEKAITRNCSEENSFGRDLSTIATKTIAWLQQESDPVESCSNLRSLSLSFTPLTFLTDSQIVEFM